MPNAVRNAVRNAGTEHSFHEFHSALNRRMSAPSPHWRDEHSALGAHYLERHPVIRRRLLWQFNLEAVGGLRPFQVRVVAE